MAHEIESFDFTSRLGANARTYERKYPWNEWFMKDGEIAAGRLLELSQQADFPGIKIGSFRQRARNAARDRHIFIRTSQKDDHTAIIEVVGPR